VRVAEITLMSSSWQKDWAAVAKKMECSLADSPQWERICYREAKVN
jgi:hypothetical protein